MVKRLPHACTQFLSVRDQQTAVLIPADEMTVKAAGCFDNAFTYTWPVLRVMVTFDIACTEVPPFIKANTALLELARQPFTKLLYLTAIGYYPAASYHDRKRAKGSHDYIFLYCVDGNGYVEEGGKRADMKANSFYILDKNTPHH